MAGFVLAALWSLFTSRDIFFNLGPEAISRALYQSNPFPEAMIVGRYLEAHCPPAGRVAVLGSEPELFFYSHRRSATGYVYVYPLMEPQPFAHVMQEQMVRQIAAANPDYVVFVGVPTSWLAGPESDPTVLEWFSRYRAERLQLAGLVETMPDYHIECTLDIPASGLTPRTDRFLEIYKRK